MKTNWRGETITDLDEYKPLLQGLKEQGMDITVDEKIPITYTRDIAFNGEPCIVCGGTKLIHGIGRYLIHDICDEEADKQPLSICGYCTNHLEERWGLDMEFE